MQSAEIREKFLKFFEEKGHKVVPSSSLVPENDPTTLFTGSGMQPMLPYLLGETHPLGTRITDSQKSFRTGDIEEVGDNRHTTFFEMLGNWSFGDYFKKEQLTWIFQFLTEEIGIDPSRLYVTVFIGDEKYGFPKDVETVNLWKELFAKKGIEAKDVEIGSEANGYVKGMQEGRIFYYDAAKNWWSRAGVPEKMPVGEPGGPDSEMFYDFGTPHDPKFGSECHPNCDCGRFLEIGNNVFMEYLKESPDSFVPLQKKNVDFGGGLERMAMAANDNPDIIAVNHRPIINHLEKVSGKKYGQDREEKRAFRIVADHMKAAVFLISDGVNPGNSDRGYFVRRLLRRAVRYADLLGIKHNTLAYVVQPIAEMYKTSYSDIYNNHLERIIDTIVKEETSFRKTLEKGLAVLGKKIEAQIVKPGQPYKVNEVRLITGPDNIQMWDFPPPQGLVTGKWIFDFYQTFGFPAELVLEELKRQGHYFFAKDYEKLDREFKEAMSAHQSLSRMGSEKKFKGGLGDTSEMSVKYHTATHLLHQALHDVLGDEVMQKGSNITPERLRFDFSFPRKLTDEEKGRVEEIVNSKIAEALPVNKVVMAKAEAEKTGARHFFGEKYPDEVSVYFIGDSLESAYSKEFCGGPHVENISTLGKFKITKEEAVSAGVRRIKAVLE